MDELDDLARYASAARTPSRPNESRPASASEAFGFGFFAGIGIWLAFVMCSLIAAALLYTIGISYTRPLPEPHVGAPTEKPDKPGPEKPGRGLFER